MDNLLDLCKRDQLDEAVSLEGLISSVNFFNKVHTDHVVPALNALSESMNCTEIMSNFARISFACGEAVTVGASCLAAFTGQVSFIFRFECIDSLLSIFTTSQ